MSQPLDSSAHRKMVELAREGDEDAFIALFHHHRSGIYGYLAGLVNKDDAYDLTQQTFLQAWKGLRHQREAAKFTAWLYRIARNLAYDFLRAKRRLTFQSLEDLDQENLFADQTDMDEQLSQKERVEQVLAKLPPKYRDCLLLQIVGGFSHREIAGIVGITEESVSTYISYARKQFRNMYQHQEKERDTTERGKSVL